jgi:hypothetical protein
MYFLSISRAVSCLEKVGLFISDPDMNVSFFLDQTLFCFLISMHFFSGNLEEALGKSSLIRTYQSCMTTTLEALLAILMCLCSQWWSWLSIGFDYLLGDATTVVVMFSPSGELLGVPVICALPCGVAPI